jgi:hypothetical protein
VVILPPRKRKERRRLCETYVMWTAYRVFRELSHVQYCWRERGQGTRDGVYPCSVSTIHYGDVTMMQLVGGGAIFSISSYFKTMLAIF